MGLIYSWLNPKLEVRNTKGGTCRGVFARVPLKTGEKLAIFGGKVIRVFEEIGDYGIQIDEEFVMGGTSMKLQTIEDTDYFNHSCNPNAGIKGQILIVAMRDIEPDEEIVFDYAMCLHPIVGRKYEFECHCGSQNCRKRITTNDWKLEELQKRYDGFFSWYLQNKIDKLKVSGGSKRDEK